MGDCVSVATGWAAGAAAVNLASGLPRRVTTTSSPAATRSSQYPNETRQDSALTEAAGGRGSEWS